MPHNQYPNPLVCQRADPWVYRHTDGNYYYTATVPAFDRIELRVAGSVAGLATAAPLCVWQKHPSGPMSHLIWAPEIHYIQEKWYIYFAAAHTDEHCPLYDTFQHRMYALCADDPLGPWRELGQVDSGLDTFCLDATAFEHEGELYYVWAQKHPQIRGNSNLYIAKMENPWTLATQPVLLAKPEYDWECSVIPVCEGPAVIRHGGRLIMTYSANATGVEYCMGMLTAPADGDPLNAANWQKHPRPVFETNAQNSRYGPGHNSFTLAEDGETPLLVYHVRETPHITGDPLQDPGRHTCVQPFTFDANGLPVFGRP